MSLGFEAEPLPVPINPDQAAFDDQFDRIFNHLLLGPMAGGMAGLIISMIYAVPRILKGKTVSQGLMNSLILGGAFIGMLTGIPGPGR